MSLKKYNVNYNANLSLMENCAEILKENPKTFIHVSKVAETGVKLAKKFNANSEKIKTACLLHDISAFIPRADYAELCRTYNYEVLPEEEKVPMLLHQKVSAILSREIFHIDDNEIVSAVACHTTLKAEPSVTDMIVFIADKLSWDQDDTPPFFDLVEAALENSLEAACLAYTNYIFDHNMIAIPHPEALSAKKYLENTVLL